ncbi:sensor histidine kinase [Isoptericola jiangsuensis]|uniref:sensor histidine kinase n=1 Tax=Isoptericola jiangsuensis TaxID=548579 RepID=UPI003AAD1A82
MSAQDHFPRFDPVRTVWASLDSVFKRQVPFALMYLVALVVVPFALDQVDVPGLVVAGIFVEVAVLVAAYWLPWHRWPLAAQHSLPLGSVVAVVLLERGCSSSAVFLTALVLVPVSTLAWTDGRRGVALATGAAVAAVLTPMLWFDDLEFPEGTLVRAVLIPLVAFALASFVAAAADNLRAHAEGQKALADQLRTSRDLMAGLVEAATEQAIIATDSGGVIEVFNRGAENLSARTAEEMIGHSVVEMRLAEELDAAVEEAGRQASAGSARDAAARFAVIVGQAATGGVHVRDWTYLRHGEPAGTVRLTVTRRVPLPGEDHGGYLFVATDITAQVESERAKDEFLGYVSHELRTPISAVLGYVELLGLDDANLTDEQRCYVEVIERNAQRLLHLVDDLLLRAQVDAGRFVVRPEPVDLAEVVAASVRSAAPFAASHQVTLLDGTAAAVPLAADPVRLAQMVDNLLSNALKFTLAGGRVVVRAALRRAPDLAPEAVLEVTDTGVGIPAQEVRQLTDRFFRASTATQRRLPGVGLGLSITKAIVDAHGGELSISSEEGVGTTFTVTLPAGTAPTSGPV